MYNLLKGVKYIHKKDIIHRDLKPGNILINKNPFELKISDFGLSIKYIKGKEQKMTLNAFTIPYLPPEVILG